MDLNVDRIVRETFHSSLEMARHVLEQLGLDPRIARARVDKFERHDQAVLQTQYLVYDDEAALVQSTKDALAELEKLFEADAASQDQPPS
jgi:glutathione-regulated potassium-efflux system protein KefB